MTRHRIFDMPLAEIYPLYLTKVTKKGRDEVELREVTKWLTGLGDSELASHLEAGTTLEDFFASVDLNPNASLITGSICGYRVQDIEDPLMQKIRYMDKLVDELAKGRPMEKILRAG